MAGWTSYKNLISEEITQRAEEGCDVTGFRSRFDECADNYDALMSLYRELMQLPIKPDFPFNEPNGFDEIMALTDGKMPKLKPLADDARLADKMYGAWLGRACGCALGKPFEAYPFVCGTEQAPGWKYIKLWYEGADAFPIKGYAPNTSSAEGLSLICPLSHRDNIKFMETDDDIRYMVIALKMVEAYGADFTPFQLGEMWLGNLPFHQVCTAEKQAYLNYAASEPDMPDRLSYVREYMNPYREFIGAEIRIDGYAYVAAGNPLLAAKMAYNDAAFSHVKNGIYGAMYSAALIAAAFTEDDPRICVQAAMSVIPKTSRLYADVQHTVELCDSTMTQEELIDALWKYNRYSWVHTNNNVMAITATVLRGNHDFEKMITGAVLTGWDTDCNGATVGSIAGALNGASAIPESWKGPLHDTMYSAIPDFHPIAISECARRSLEVFRRIRNK